jgi:hypothetical protein
MAFRIMDVAVSLSSLNGPVGQCTCGPASGMTGGGACPAPSKRDEMGGARPGRLSALKVHLRQILSSQV